MRPQTPHQISFFFIAMKKERNLDKERKNTLPNTVSKLNPSLVNSLRSNKTRLVIVSLRNCRKKKKINIKFIMDSSGTCFRGLLPVRFRNKFGMTLYLYFECIWCNVVYKFLKKNLEKKYLFVML